MMAERVQTPSSKQRKEDLLKRAARIFAEKGYQVVTVQEIADDLSLSKGGLYWHFKSKEDLYIQVCRNNCTSSLALIQSILDLPKLDWETVFLKHKNLLLAYLDDPMQVALIFDFYAEAKRVPLIHEEITNLIRNREEKLSRLVNRMVVEKVIEPVNPEQTASLLVAFMTGAMFKFSVMNNRDECIEEFSRQYNNLLPAYNS